uniref:Uncharacterized protein n=1 Tax=Vitis vinifera TaxID=29760 RepID=A5C8F6_VITVI|nr:hypothetical protein VITISV_007324 [Vitis vinifera]
MGIGRQSHQVERQFRKLRNHKVQAMKSAFSCEIDTFSLRNFHRPCKQALRMFPQRMSGYAFCLLELRKLGKVSNAKIGSFVVSAFNEKKILEYLGFSIEPRLEHHHLCRERFTLEKWNQLAGYSTSSEVSPMVAPPVPTPKAISAAPPTTPSVPPVAPTTFEPSITISASEFCALPNPPASSTPIAPVEDTTLAEVRIPTPQDEPPTVTTTPKEASSPPEAPIT